LEYEKKALEIDREIGNRNGEALDLNNIGSIYQSKGERKKALKYYKDALKIFIEIGAQKHTEKVKLNIQNLKFEKFENIKCGNP